MFQGRILPYYIIICAIFKHLHQGIICSRREIVALMASPLWRSSCCVLLRGGEVSGPIMRNTCWPTQIENAAIDERVTACGQLVSPHLQITVPTQTSGSRTLSCDATPEKTLESLSFCFLNQGESLSSTIRLEKTLMIICLQVENENMIRGKSGHDG